MQDMLTMNIVVRGNDTDIFVILLVNIHQLKRSHLWYECGLDHDNSRSFYDITRLAAAIPFNSWLCLVFTGSLALIILRRSFEKGKCVH